MRWAPTCRRAKPPNATTAPSVESSHASATCCGVGVSGGTFQSLFYATTGTFVVLMIAVGLSYRQLIKAYPHGGGSYVVAGRTREIGLRMAVGAKARHILLQFLIEAVTLSLIGGIIGIALGLGGAEALSYFAEWRTLVAPQAIAVAFGFAAAIGIFFGFYPARKAARLDPIEALRYE